MIIGNGMMAKAFSARQEDDVSLIFASGVSDSNETVASAFLREEMLLRDAMRTYPHKTLVYFSTCSIYDSTLHNSPYIYHKLNMERLIRDNQATYVIFRLPQVVGFTRSPTIVNFLYHKIRYGDSFELWKNSKRNLIDVEDVVDVINAILDHQLLVNRIVNLASTRTDSIYDIVSVIEELTGKQARYREVEKGGFYHIDLSQVMDVYRLCHINFGGGGNSAT